MWACFCAFFLPLPMLFKKSELVVIADPNLRATSNALEIGDYFEPGAFVDDRNKAVGALECKMHVTHFV